MDQDLAADSAQRGWFAMIVVAAVLFLSVSALTYAWYILPPYSHPQAAAYRGVAATRQTLADEFRSYDSVDQVTKGLEQSGLSFKRRSARRPESRDYPPRVLDTLAIVNYEQFGEPGELSLEFFNDRLFEVQFMPQNPEAYARKLHASEPDLRRDRNGRSEQVRGVLRVATNIDLASNLVGRALRITPYAIWQDLRLVRERDDWDAKYGGIPYSAP